MACCLALLAIFGAGIGAVRAAWFRLLPSRAPRAFAPQAERPTPGGVR